MAKNNGKGYDFDQLGKSQGFSTRSTTHSVQEALVVDLFIKTYKSADYLDDSVPQEYREYNKKVNQKIEEGYLKKFGKEMPAIFKSGKIKPIPKFIWGIPGQGKTACIRSAAREFSNLCGFNFVDQIDESFEPNKDTFDFVLVVQETAGETSSLGFGGLPRVGEMEYMDKKGNKVVQPINTRAFNKRMTAINRAVGGIFLLDDAANSLPVIQNVMLPLAQNNSFQGLTLDGLIALTGNFGAVDGTHTSELTTALMTRVDNIYAVDTVNDYVDRLYKTTNDDLGDLGLISFLKNNEGYFAQQPDVDNKTGFACSRTYDLFNNKVRLMVAHAGGRDQLGNLIDAIGASANGFFGKEIGEVMKAYYHRLASQVDPIVKAVIVDGDFNGKKDYIKGKMEDDVAKSMDFEYQFAFAIGDYFAAELGRFCDKYGIDRVKQNDTIEEDVAAMMKKPDVVKLVKNFTDCISTMRRDAMVSLTMNHIRSKIFLNIPSLCRPAASAQTGDYTKKTSMKMFLKGFNSGWLEAMEGHAREKGYAINFEGIIIPTIVGIDQAPGSMATVKGSARSRKRIS